jgi:hypothetical protein
VVVSAVAGGAEVKRLLTLLLFASPAFAQTPVTVANPSFELPVLANAGQYTETAPSGWKAGGNFSVGAENASPNAPDGVNVAWINPGGALNQDLGTQAAGTYTLTFWAAGNALSALTVTFGTCSQTFTGLVAAYALETMTCTLSASADLPLSFSDLSSQATIDNVAVTLTAPPPPPPQYQTLTFGAQLVNCTICDGTDPQPLASASIYQGLSFALQQQGTTVQNICKATLNANAIATCNGPVNVQPAVVTFLITVFSAAGTPMFDTFAFAAPSLIIGGAPTGNVKIVIGFDATTSVPRAGFVFTQ